jgi:Uma2 family endonuclease
MNTRLVNLPEILTITQEQFRKIAAANRDLRLEKTAQGKLIIIPLMGGNTGKKISI